MIRLFLQFHKIKTELGKKQFDDVNFSEKMSQVKVLVKIVDLQVHRLKSTRSCCGRR